MGLLKKLGIVVIAFFLLSTCVGVVSDEDATNEEGVVGGDAAEATQQDVWLTNYMDREEQIRSLLARRVPAVKPPRNAANVAVSSCDEVAQRAALKKRLRMAKDRWGASATQAPVVLGIVLENVCPRVAKVHTAQVKAKKRADARASARRAAAVERARAVAVEKAERERRAAEEAQQPASAYYDNCTDVENAGAAPIYAGDPGFGSHLDRDGDGVACES